MNTEETNPLEECAKGYFQQLLQQKHDNIEYGDTLTMAVMFRREDGSWYTVSSVSVNKDDKPL